MQALDATLAVAWPYWRYVYSNWAALGFCRFCGYDVMVGFRPMNAAQGRTAAGRTRKIR
jgi:hypothetical protein